MILNPPFQTDNKDRNPDMTAASEPLVPPQPKPTQADPMYVAMAQPPEGIVPQPDTAAMPKDIPIAGAVSQRIIDYSKCK
jgi:hypothetical protein